MTKPTLIIDLDGTLVVCAKYYTEAVRRGAEEMERTTGLPIEAGIKLIDAIDHASLHTPDAFKRERFPKSFYAAGMAAAALADQKPNRGLATRMWHIGDSVFDAPYELIGNVLHALTEMRSRGYQLVIYTKGDVSVQEAKIERHNLHEIIDTSVVTLKKDVAALAQLVLTCGVDVERSFAIGDSLKDDIAPANELGIKTIHIWDEAHNAVWSYDDAAAEPVFHVKSVYEALYLIPNLVGDEGVSLTPDLTLSDESEEA